MNCTCKSGHIKYQLPRVPYLTLKHECLSDSGTCQFQIRGHESTICLPDVKLAKKKRDTEQVCPVGASQRVFAHSWCWCPWCAAFSNTKIKLLFQVCYLASSSLFTPANTQLGHASLLWKCAVPSFSSQRRGESRKWRIQIMLCAQPLTFGFRNVWLLSSKTSFCCCWWFGQITLTTTFASLTVVCYAHTNFSASVWFMMYEFCIN